MLSIVKDCIDTMYLIQILDLEYALDYWCYGGYLWLWLLLTVFLGFLNKTM